MFQFRILTWHLKVLPLTVELREMVLSKRWLNWLEGELNGEMNGEMNGAMDGEMRKKEKKKKEKENEKGDRGTTCNPSKVYVLTMRLGKDLN
jgi:hypothetical protein